MTTSSASTAKLSELYEQDFCLWAEEIALLLKTGHFSALDLAHLIDEVEDMSSSQKRALLSNLRVLLLHLLKYHYQPEKRSSSWLSTIVEHRLRLEDDLEESPSLKVYCQENFPRAYQKARRQAAVETGLSLATFPEQCPFAQEDVLNTVWLPE
ncbi:DUF29 domain-containing protein [Nodosilinea sp. LEGE 07298]|uniref:DUF29 domain-containing protein n=1 Tax=Nodosilinea sp. LEGE 07298 TaxID=2777970 RepID=UPI0018806C6D|nr:DUF29 domain-containing protein [Nodosilinea sp. LEGE 07298]MBE9111491.1 DUF29 domain-containing protein [Nodosilinea sp. LEGE 07298]